MVQACLSETSRRDGCNDGHSRCGHGASQTGEEATPSDGSILYVKDAPGDLPEDLQNIRASGVLRVGIQSGDPPYYQEDPVSGELSGIDVDLAYEAARRKKPGRTMRSIYRR